MSDATLAKLNAVARSAVEDPQARARSGSGHRRDVAFDAIYHYDRDHTRLFNRDIRSLWTDYHNDYIDNHEYHAEFTRVFVNLGVVPNRHYSGAQDRYLLRLDGTYELQQESAALIGALYPQNGLELPVLQTVAARDSAWRNNFSRGDLSVLDPASIERSARLFLLDERSLTDAIALHEAQHEILAQILGGRKSSVITPLLGEISATTDNILRFHHWLEVDEFLADAVQVLHSQQGLRYAATRIVRAGPSIGVMHSAAEGDGRSVRKRPHDASALFFYRLLLRYEAEKEKAGHKIPVEGRINSIRKSLQQNYTRGKPIPREWIENTWLPWIDRTLTADVEQYIRQRYQTVLQQTLALLRQESEPFPVNGSVTSTNDTGGQ